MTRAAARVDDLVEKNLIIVCTLRKDVWSISYIKCM